MENPMLNIFAYTFMPSGFLFKFLQRFCVKKKKGFVLQDHQMSLLLLYIVKDCKQGKQMPSYLGKFASVGTWQERWNTLGHFSQHRSSPPFWQTAHQSSLGSSSFLVSPTWRGDFWEASSHSDFPFEEFSWWSPGWSPVLSGASDLNTDSSDAALWLLFRSREVSMLLG